VTSENWQPDGVDLQRPNVARVYDYYLGGSHNFAADREMARRAIALWPDLPKIIRSNRAFLQRAVAFLAKSGVRQFVDLGSGMPTAGSVHEVARAHDPGARVVYVDIDPVAVAYGQRLLAGRPNLVTVDGDLRRPALLGSRGRKSPCWKSACFTTERRVCRSSPTGTASRSTMGRCRWFTRPRKRR